MAWAARDIRRRTKVLLFKTLVRPVLLYGCEFWKITKNDERKLNSFQCQCLRWKLWIRWQQRMTNKTIIELAEINDTSCEVRRRRLNWLVHILRREGENDCCTALGCAFSVYASKLSNSLPLKLKKKIVVRSIHLRISLKHFFLTVHFANIYYFFSLFWHFVCALLSPLFS